MSKRSGTRLRLPLPAFGVVMAALLTAPPGRAQLADPPDAGGSEIVQARCFACHGPDLIVQQRLSRSGWEREVGKMIGWGAVLDESQRRVVVDYLAAQFGPEGPSSLAPSEADSPGAAIVNRRCRLCHDLRLIEQQRLAAPGWAREVEKMVGWGAAVAEEDKATLINYLANRFAPGRP